MLAQLRKVPQIADVSSDQQDRGLDASLQYDRQTAMRLGITAELIDNTLYDAFGQRQVSTMFTPLNQYHVVMEAEPRFWQNPQSLRDIYVRSPAGAQVPLSAFSRYEPTSTALAVNHQGQFPAVTLSFNLAPGVALGEAGDAIPAPTPPLGVAASIPGRVPGTGPAVHD